jgi:hypothetical protein
MARFGSSGIRGLANVEVTADLALRVGAVVGELYGSAIVGRDSRTTGPMLASAFCAGVLSAGADAVDAGLVSTPTLARGAADYGCGIVITASHNPAPYNGIKLWNPDGSAFDEAQQAEVEAALDAGRTVAFGSFTVPLTQTVDLLVSSPSGGERIVTTGGVVSTVIAVRKIEVCRAASTATITIGSTPFGRVSSVENPPVALKVTGKPLTRRATTIASCTLPATSTSLRSVRAVVGEVRLICGTSESTKTPRPV